MTDRPDRRIERRPVSGLAVSSLGFVLGAPVVLAGGTALITLNQV